MYIQTGCMPMPPLSCAGRRQSDESARFKSRSSKLVVDSYTTEKIQYLRTMIFSAQNG